MEEKKVILDEKSVERSLIRIAHEIIEKNKGVENLVLVGIKRRGVPLAHRTAKNIENIEGVTVETVSLDITSYRDDLELQDKPGTSNPLDIKCDITDKAIILFDDVLYTGRTVRAALDALIDIGRPRSIQLAVLIDRGHRELPIRPDYVGKNVPTSREEIVKVNLFEIDGNNEVVIYKK